MLWKARATRTPASFLSTFTKTEDEREFFGDGMASRRGNGAHGTGHEVELLLGVRNSFAVAGLKL